MCWLCACSSFGPVWWGDLLKLARSRSEETATLLGCCPRRCEAQNLLHVLADGHRAEDVQEDEGTLVVVFAGKIAMAQALNP